MVTNYKRLKGVVVKILKIFLFVIGVLYVGEFGFWTAPHRRITQLERYVHFTEEYYEYKLQSEAERLRNKIQGVQDNVEEQDRKIELLQHEINALESRLSKVGKKL